MLKHAMLSASGASRWMTCTPSARLEQEIQEITSAYADEGTLAHDYAIWMIKHKAYGINIDKKVAEVKAHPLYQAEMTGHVEDYSNFVVDIVRKAPGQTMLIQEERIDLSHWIPLGFGTVDNGVAWWDGLHIVDLKYGKGVPVSAYENKQMMVYALGVLARYELLFPIKDVFLTIYQPRIENIDTYEITADNLRAWGEEVLKPTAKIAYEGLGDFLPGDHCRFCRAKPYCKANHDLQMELAVREFAPPALISDEDIVQVLKRAKQIKSWLSAVEKEALRLALVGKEWPGMKVVEGRSNRKYKDDQLVISELVKAGYDPHEISTRKPLGITAMKGTIESHHMRLIVEPLLIKPMGKPALVPVEDARPVLDKTKAAAIDFAVEEEEDE